MEYAAKSVTTPRGLSQEQALEELQNHPKFKVGSRIKSIRQTGDRWQIRILEPKTAEFPPPKDDEEESDGPPAPPSDEGPSADDSADDSEGPSASDSPDGPPSDGPKEKKSEGGEIKEVLGLLHTLLDALGLGAPGPEGPDAGPPPPPPGPPGAGAPPEHGGARPGAGRPPGPGAGGGPAVKPVRDVPPGANPIAGFASAQHMASQIPTFQATAPDDGSTSIKQAKIELESVYGPYYKVKQLTKDDNGNLRALLSVR